MADTLLEGWQVGRSLQDCMGLLLDKQLAADVFFEVNGLDGSKVVVKGHRCILMSRSKVFETMLSGQLSKLTSAETRTESRVIPLEIQADIFRDMLRYIYTDDVAVSALSALPLMYSANKFMLPNLAAKCKHYIEENLTEDNVCTILDSSLQHGESELKERCIHFICVNGAAVFKTDAFKELSYDAFEILIGTDGLEVTENEVHNACVDWATRQLLKERERDNPTYQQIRTKLGNALYRIRYPTLAFESFADLVGTSELLTDQERSTVYYFIAKLNKTDTLMFDHKPRAKQLVVERFTSTAVAPWQPDQSCTDAIQFTTNKHITITAVGLYSGHMGFDYKVTINFQVKDDIISTTTSMVRSDPATNIVKVALNQPLDIKAGTAYILWTTPVDQMYGLYGNGGQPTTTVNDVTFSFTDTTTFGSNTNNSQGQLPQLYFNYDPQQADTIAKRYLSITDKPWDSVDGNDAIQFKSDKNFNLTALGLYSGVDGAEYDATIKVQCNEEIISTTTKNVVDTSGVQIIKVPFDTAVPIKADSEYKIWTHSAAKRYAVYGTNGRRMCTVEDVTLTFSAANEPETLTTLAEGQIPRLYLDIPPKKVKEWPEYDVRRFDDIVNTPWHTTPGTDAIRFMTNKDIILTAFGLFQGEGAVDYNINVVVQLNGENIASTNGNVHVESANQTIVRIHFFNHATSKLDPCT